MTVSLCVVYSYDVDVSSLSSNTQTKKKQKKTLRPDGQALFVSLFIVLFFSFFIYLFQCFSFREFGRKEEAKGF